MYQLYLATKSYGTCKLLNQVTKTPKLLSHTEAQTEALFLEKTVLCSEERTSCRQNHAEQPGKRLRGNSKRGCPEGRCSVTAGSPLLSFQTTPMWHSLLCPRGWYLLIVPKHSPFQIQNLCGNVVAYASTVCTYSGCRWMPEGQSPFLISAWYGWENVWLGFVDCELSLCIRRQYLREEISPFVSRNMS